MKRHAMNLLTATLVAASKSKQAKETLEEKIPSRSSHHILGGSGLNPEPHAVASICARDELN